MWGSTRSSGGDPVVPPVSVSVAYTYDLEALASGGPREEAEVKYSRENNPTTMLLEGRLAGLEGARWGLAFNSGMAAITALLLYWRLGRGGRVVVERLSYGSTRAAASWILGDRLTVAGPPWDELLHEADKPGVGLVLVETMGNPTLRVPPLRDLARVCLERDCVLAVDNTMASPVLARPLGLGAGLVVESLTKYIIGSNDALGGLIAGADGILHAALWRARRLLGSILQPREAYQALKGLETLSLRVPHASRTALEVARWLEESGLAERVYYPGLESHPDHHIARRILRGGYGGVVSFDLGSRERALALLSRLRRIRPAPSFGATQPLASYPYASSHRNLPEEERERLGVTPGLVRLSVGVATPEEIIGDLEAALS